MLNGVGSGERAKPPYQKIIEFFYSENRIILLHFGAKWTTFYFSLVTTTLYSYSHLFKRKTNPNPNSNPIGPKCCHGAKVGYCRKMHTTGS